MSRLSATRRGALVLIVLIVAVPLGGCSRPAGSGSTGTLPPATPLPPPMPSSSVAAGRPEQPSQPAAPDQPIGLRFPPPPADLNTLQVPPGNGHSVSLSFDDGPSPDFTPQILALLTASHAPAVFCLIGQQAVRLPHLVRQEVAAGFKLCDHSRDHDLDMQRKGPGFQAREVTDGLHDIQQAAPGAQVQLYRQPGGFWNPTVVEAMYQAGLTPLRWSDDPRDWSRPGAAAIAQRVLLRLQPGAVVLLHDGGGNRTQTVQALAWLLKALPAAGWHFTLPATADLSPQDAARPE